VADLAAGVRSDPASPATSGAFARGAVTRGSFAVRAAGKAASALDRHQPIVLSENRWYSIGMADNKTKSFYLPPDVLDYLSSQENASATVTKLVRREAFREATAAAYARIHGRPLTDEARQRAQTWAREQLAAAAAHADEHRTETDELRRRMGWAA
jgi:hypothetical protein